MKVAADVAARSPLCGCAHLDVQRGEVAVQLLGVVDVRLAAHGTHHVPDVLVPHGDSKVDPEAVVTHGALARSQRLHLNRGRKNFRWEIYVVTAAFDTQWYV